MFSNSIWDLQLWCQIQLHVFIVIKSCRLYAHHFFVLNLTRLTGAVESGYSSAARICERILKKLQQMSVDWKTELRHTNLGMLCTWIFLSSHVLNLHECTSGIIYFANILVLSWPMSVSLFCQNSLRLKRTKHNLTELKLTGPIRHNFLHSTNYICMKYKHKLLYCMQQRRVHLQVMNKTSMNWEQV